VVTGPKKPVLPPTPQWTTIKDGWEIVGLGTIFSDGQGPHIHLHGALGQGKKGFVGCLRKSARVFLVVEAIVWEMNNIKAKRSLDKDSQMKILSIQKSKKAGK
jgi:uncharacterized protein